jgi:hypothetical protein
MIYVPLFLPVLTGDQAIDFDLVDFRVHAVMLQQTAA